jgi:hypothetical protein
MDKNILPRIGTFFILIGCGFLILFVGSILAAEFNISILYLFFAAAAMFIGFLLRRTAPRPEPTRFSSIRKASQRSRQRREEKQALKEQDK